MSDAKKVDEPTGVEKPNDESNGRIIAPTAEPHTASHPSTTTTEMPSLEPKSSRSEGGQPTVDDATDERTAASDKEPALASKPGIEANTASKNATDAGPKKSAVNTADENTSQVSQTLSPQQVKDQVQAGIAEMKILLKDLAEARKATAEAMKKAEEAQQKLRTEFVVVWQVIKHAKQVHTSLTVSMKM